MGNFNRKSQEITGVQYWAYFNGGLNLREVGFNRKRRVARTHFNGKLQEMLDPMGKKGSQDSFQWEIAGDVGLNGKKGTTRDSFQQEIPHLQYLAYINGRNLR